LGFLLEESGRTAEAEEAYRRAVDRGSRSAAVNLGHMLEQRNDRAGAIEAYTAAVRLGDVRSMRRLAALGQTVMNTPDGVTVYPATIWGLNVTMARDTYAAGKLTAEAYEQILREAVERSHDADDVSLAMDQRRAHQHRDRRRAADLVGPTRRHHGQPADHLGRPRRRRPLCPLHVRAHRRLVPGTQARHQGHISAGGVDKDVTFTDADPDLNDQIDAAYRDKYQRYGERIIGGVVNPEARAATIKLVPR